MYTHTQSYILSLTHTRLNQPTNQPKSTPALVDNLLNISAELARTGATAHAEETLLRPLLEERCVRSEAAAARVHSITLSPSLHSHGCGGHFPHHARLHRERASAAFDPTHLVDFRERLLLPQGEALPVDRISPLIKNPGVVMLTDRRFYFQPAADLNNVGSAHPVSFPLGAIVQVRCGAGRCGAARHTHTLSSQKNTSTIPASRVSPHSTMPSPSSIMSRVSRFRFS